MWQDSAAPGQSKADLGLWFHQVCKGSEAHPEAHTPVWLPTARKTHLATAPAAALRCYWIKVSAPASFISFTELEFTHDTIHPFRVYSSVVFSASSVV